MAENKPLSLYELLKQGDKQNKAFSEAANKNAQQPTQSVVEQRGETPEERATYARLMGLNDYGASGMALELSKMDSAKEEMSKSAANVEKLQSKMKPQEHDPLKVDSKRIMQQNITQRAAQKMADEPTSVKGVEDKSKAAAKHLGFEPYILKPDVQSRKTMRDVFDSTDPLYESQGLAAAFKYLDTLPTNEEGKIVVDGLPYSRMELAQALAPQIVSANSGSLFANNATYRDDMAKRMGYKNMDSYLAALDQRLAAMQRDLTNQVSAQHAIQTPFNDMAGLEALATQERAGAKVIRDLRDQIKSMRAGEGGFEQFFKGLNEGFDAVNMATFGIADLASEYKQNIVYNKMLNGDTLTPEERILADALNIKSDLDALRKAQGQSWYNNIGAGVGYIAEIAPQFIGPMLAAKGLFKPINVGVKGAWEMTKKAASKGFTNALKTGLGATARVGDKSLNNIALFQINGMLTAPLQASTYSRFLEKRNAQYSIKDGKVTYTPTDAWRDLVDTWIEQGAEVGSELFGVSLEKFTSASLAAIGRNIGLGKVMRKIGGSVRNVETSKAMRFVKSGATKAGQQLFGYAGGVLPETLSEIYGDLTSEMFKSVLTGNGNFEEFKNHTYWSTAFALSGIYGGAISVLPSMVDYASYMRDISALGDKKKNAISKIEHADLKNALIALSAGGSIKDATKLLAELDWKNGGYSLEEIGYAMDYVRAEAMQQVRMGEATESQRLQRFDNVAQNIKAHAYRNEDGTPSESMVMAVDKDGNSYHILEGDYSNAEATLKALNSEGKVVPLLASNITSLSKASIAEVTLFYYQQMFSTEFNMQRLESAEYAIERMDNPTMAQMADVAKRVGIVMPKEGDTITLVDGRTAKVTSISDDLGIMAEMTDGEGNVSQVTIPIMQILSSNTYIAEAQKLQNAEDALELAQAEEAQAEAEDTVEEGDATTDVATEEESNGLVGTEVTLPDGNKGTIVEVDGDDVVVDTGRGVDAYEVYSKEELGMTEAAETTTPQSTQTTAEQTSSEAATEQTTGEVTPEQATEALNQIAGIENIPRNEDGSVNYDAINEPNMYAKLFEHDMGSREEAINSVQEMREQAMADLAEAEKKGKKARTANEKVANKAERQRLAERIAFYDNVLDIYTPKAEAPATPIESAPQVDTTPSQTETQSHTEAAEGVQPSETTAEEQADGYSKYNEKLKRPVGLQQNELSERLEEKTRRMINDVATAFGVEVIFQREVRSSAGNLVNGKIEGSTVYFSWGKREHTLTWLMGHEFTHRMKSLSPEAYKKLRDAVRAYLGEGKWNRLIEKQRKIYEERENPEEIVSSAESAAIWEEAKEQTKREDGSYDEEAAEMLYNKKVAEARREAYIEEVVCDEVGVLARDHKAFDKFLRSEHVRNDGKLLSWLRKVWQSIKSAFIHDVRTFNEVMKTLDELINVSTAKVAKGVEPTEGGENNSLIGEVGASALDKAEEATIRLDNLNIARQMEERGDSALDIRMATDWERGADGLWRYEIMDAEVNLYDGDENIIRKKIEVAEEEEYDFIRQSKADTKELRERTNTYLAEMREKYGVAEGEETDAMTEEEIAQLQSLTNKEIEFEDYKERRRNELYNHRMALEAQLGYVRVKNTDASAMIQSTRLGHILQGNDAEVLFTAHPSLRDIEVQFVTDIRDGAFAAYVTKGGYKRIELNVKKTPVDMLAPYILHEVQHAIQDIEGFAGGGNLSSLESDENVTAKEAYDYYHKIAGEVEARNVSARINMTPEERRATLLSETEDVAREDQIFLREGVEMAQPKFSLQETNDRFNAELDAFKAGTHKGLLHLGYPSEILKVCGVGARELTISPRELSRHLKKHNLTTDDLKDLVYAIQEPIMVYKHGKKHPNIVVITEVMVNNGKLSVSIELDEEGNVVEISNISSVHSKDALTELDRLSELSDEELKKALKWVDKEKVSGWLMPTPYMGSGASLDPKHLSTANIIQNFQNPNVSTKNSLITPEMDASYLDAVKRGDMATAQKMVMEAAKLAMPNTKVVDEDGNPKVVYHQTNHSVYINRETGQNWDELDWRERMEWDERDDWDDYWEEREFNTFSRVNARTTQELDGFFFAPEYDEYHEYGDRTIEAFLNITNPASFGDYNIDSSKTNAGRDERIRLQNEGYDGVINEEDGAIWEYIAFEPNQIKSADPVTYDDAGNVIPLSERFNPRKEDIRYSLQTFDDKVQFVSNIVREFNIDVPYIIADTIEEYLNLLNDLGRKIKDGDEETVGMYFPNSDAISLNGALLKSKRDIHRAIIHENTHSVITKYLMSELEKVAKTLRDQDIEDVRKDVFGDNYKDETPIGVLEEIVCYLVEKLPNNKIKAIFTGEKSIEDYTKALREDFEAMEEIAHKEVLYAILPIIEKSVEKQKEQYGKEKAANIIIPRVSSVEGVDSGAKGREITKIWEGGAREISKPSIYGIASQGESGAAQEEAFRDRRGSKYNGDSRRDILTPTRYSLQSGDMPFFNDNGDVITFDNTDITGEDYDAVELRSPMPTTPRTTEKVIKEYLSARHNAAKERIRRESRVLRDAVRKQYREEQVRRREGVESMRTNAAKVDYIIGAPIETLDYEAQVLAMIAMGTLSISWESLSKELGVKLGDKKSYRHITNGATATLDAVVHAWWESINGYENGIDTHDLRNALIDVLMQVPTAKGALSILEDRFDHALRNRDEALEDIDREEDRLIAEEDARYNEQMTTLSDPARMSEYIRQYEQTVGFHEELTAIEGTLRKMDSELKAVRKRAERAQMRSKASKQKQFDKSKEIIGKQREFYKDKLAEQRASFKEVREAITESKRALIEALSTYEQLGFNKQEVRSLVDAVNKARSMADINKVRVKIENVILNVSIREKRRHMDQMLNLRLPSGELVETWVSKQIHDGKMSVADGKRILADMFRGTNANGVRVAKYVDDETARVMDYLRKNLIVPNHGAHYKKKKDADGNVIGREYVRPREAEMGADVLMQANNERCNELLGKAVEGTITEEDKIELQARQLYEPYLFVANARAYVKGVRAEGEKLYEEIQRKKAELGDAYTKEERDADYAALEANALHLVEAKTAYDDALTEYNETLSKVITSGRDKLGEFRKTKEAHKTKVVNMAIRAIGGEARTIASQPTVAETIAAWNRTTFHSTYWTFDSACREIDRFAPNGEGEFYKHFMGGMTKASNDFFTRTDNHIQDICDAVRRITGSRRDPRRALRAFMRKADMTTVGSITYKNEKGKMESVPLRISNALFTLAMWGQAQYREIMEKRGITKEQMEALKAKIESIDGRYIDFMEWVIDSFLPSTRLEYNEVHKQLFGASMDNIENYFPAKVVEGYRDEDIAKVDSGLPSTMTGSIITRQKHNNMPQFDQSFFSVLLNHIQNMDQWASFSPLVEDLNAVISNPEFKRLVNTYMAGVNNDRTGKGSLWQIFKDTSAVAIGSYSCKTQVADSMISKFTGAWAASNISWRISTALKQLSGITAVAVSGFGKAQGMFLKNMLSPLAVKWAMENSPMLQKRFGDRFAGNEVLMRKYGQDQAKGLDLRKGKLKDGLERVNDFIRFLTVDVGMTLNAAVDAFVVAVTMKTVYDVELSNLTKGKPETATEEQKSYAMMKAEIFANETQQSAEGAYLSVPQAQRSAVTAAMTTYLNASFASHRLRAQGIQDIYRWMSPKYRKEIDDRYGKGAARKAAGKGLARLLSGISIDATFILMSRAVGQGLWRLIIDWFDDTEDNDDEADPIDWSDIGWEIGFQTAFGGMLGGNIITSLRNGYKPSVMPALEELKKLGYDLLGWTEAKIKKGDWSIDLNYWALGEITFKYGYGLDPETMLNIARGIEGICRDKDPMAAMKILNTPQSMVNIIAGPRRDNETVKEYVERRARLEVLFAQPKYSELYNDEGKFIGKRKYDVVGGAKDYRLKGLFKEYNERQRAAVMSKYLSPSEVAKFERIDSEYKAIVESLGWEVGKNPVDDKVDKTTKKYKYPNGLIDVHYAALKEIATEAERTRRAQDRWIGSDMGFANLIRTEYSLRSEVIKGSKSRRAAVTAKEKIDRAEKQRKKNQKK